MASQSATPSLRMLWWRNEVASFPGEEPSPAPPEVCPSCRVLQLGRRELGWQVFDCLRCGHSRYGSHRTCDCRPEHGNPEALRRILQAAISQRQWQDRGGTMPPRSYSTGRLSRAGRKRPL
jgi:hypothetical protein